MFKVILGNVPYTYKIFYQYDIKEVAVVDPKTSEVTYHFNKKLVGTRAVLSQGEEFPEMDATATCHTKDTPNKVYGRTLATARLANAYLHPREEKELWDQLKGRKMRFDERILKSRNC